MGSMAWRHEASGIMSVDIDAYRLIIQRLGGGSGETRFLVYSLATADRTATLLFSKHEQSVAAAMDSAEHFAAKRAEIRQASAIPDQSRLPALS